MTTGEQLDSISTVSNTTALDHLLNPSGTGGGGDIIVNSEINYLFESGADQISDFDDIIMVKDDTTIIKIEDMAVDTISDADDHDDITEAEEDLIYEV